MNWFKEDVNSAFKIFIKLLEKGYLNSNDSELLNEYARYLLSVSEKWENIEVFNENRVNLKHGKDRVSFITKVLTFLEKEDLIKVENQEEIYLLPKFENTISKIYFNNERKELLLNFLLN